ncbi:MAG: energy-coupled thiamine transporter ThiT [Hydrogenoanaerobacterium sp.]
MTEAKNKTRILTECALMVAISAVLQLIPPMQMPQGGSLTFGAMVPIVFISLRHGVKWGLLTAFVGSLIQMLLGGISAPPTETFWWFLLVILLDYVIAYTVLGLCKAIYGKPPSYRGRHRCSLCYSNALHLPYNLGHFNMGRLRTGGHSGLASLNSL